MNKVSSVVTGGIALSAMQLAPLIQWAMNGFPKPVPDGMSLLIAGCLITAGHALYNIFTTRRAAKAIPAVSDVGGAQPASTFPSKSA